MIAYKVVSRDSLNRRRSAYVSHIAPYFAVEYKENEWVYPKKYALMAFETLEQANNFCYSSEYGWGNEIWKCEVEVDKTAQKILSGYSNELQDWLGEEEFNEAQLTKTPIIGTIFCKAIKLLEYIDV